MAEILIKDIEIPKKGNVGILIYADGSVEVCGKGALSKPIYGTPTTKAIEVPPHGDLIERDELPLNHITDYNLEGHSVVDIEDVLNAPTVLEATGGRKK